MSLATGSYTIRSALPYGLYAGHNPATKDQKIEARYEPATWYIEDIGYDRYYLKTDGLPTTAYDKLVFTTVYPPGEKWQLERVPQHGYNQYLIRTDNGTLPVGWVLPYDKPSTQVAVQGLASTKSLPPQYPPSERWIIEELD